MYHTKCQDQAICIAVANVMAKNLVPYLKDLAYIGIKVTKDERMF